MELPEHREEIPRSGLTSRLMGEEADSVVAIVLVVAVLVDQPRLLAMPAQLPMAVVALRAVSGTAIMAVAVETLRTARPTIPFMAAAEAAAQA